MTDQNSATNPSNVVVSDGGSGVTPLPASADSDFVPAVAPAEYDLHDFGVLYVNPETRPHIDALAPIARRIGLNQSQFNFALKAAVLGRTEDQLMRGLFDLGATVDQVARTALHLEAYAWRFLSGDSPAQSAPAMPKQNRFNEIRGMMKDTHSSYWKGSAALQIQAEYQSLLREGYR